MLLWFLGLSVVIVWLVFRDTALDYRMVMAGAVLPDTVDAFTGGVWVGHTLPAGATLLAVVMVGTRGRRRLRRRLLAVPVGSLLHLFLDGVWTTSTLFWWPALGTELAGGRLPSLERPAGLLVLQEVVGAAALAWWVWRFRLYEPQRWRTFARSGRLGRDLVT